MNLAPVRKNTLPYFRRFLICAFFMNAAIPDIQAEHQWLEFLKTREGRQKARIAAISLLTLIFCGVLLFRKSRKNKASVQQKKEKRKKTRTNNTLIPKQIKSEIQLQNIEIYKDQSKEYLQLLGHILIAACLDKMSFSIQHTIIVKQDDKQGVIDILFAPVDMQQKLDYVPTWLTSIAPQESPLSYIKNHSTDSNKRILLEQLILLDKNYKKENEIQVNEKIDRLLHVGLHNSPRDIQLRNYQEGQYDEYVIVHKLPTVPNVDEESIPYLKQQALLNLLHAIFYEWSLGTEARYTFSQHDKNELRKLNNQNIIDVVTTYVRGRLANTPEEDNLFLCTIEQGQKKPAAILKVIRDICSKSERKNTGNVIVIEDRDLREKFLKYCMLYSNEEEIDFTDGKIEIKKSHNTEEHWHYLIDPQITKKTAEKIFVSYGLPLSNT